MTTAVESKRVHVLNRKLVPLKRLKDAPHNPPARIDPKNLRELMDSMDMIGLLHPVTVNAEWEIIDGHRRVASARGLGWLDIECNVVNEDAASVYASVNVSSRRMSGNDALSVWLVNTHAVPTGAAARFAEMVGVVGKQVARVIADKGLSIRVFQTAKRICRYCDDTDDGTVKAVTLWLVNTAIIGQVMKALEAGESPKLIMEAVKKDKPIVFKMHVGE